MLDQFKAGQSIKCTIAKAPRNAANRKTLERLMRLQPSVARGLRNAHRKRQQNLVVYNRGNRDWTKRESCGKIIKVAKGATWTMVYSVTLAPDLQSIADCIKVEKA
ncbi:MAG: hypothetical protein AB7K52_09770 [Phycisphaerales bacterium]